LTADPRDRWREVDVVFQEALERPADDRPSFLLRRCGDDTTLRRAVEALLEANEEAEGFLERPVEDVCRLPWTEVFEATADPSEGTQAREPRDRTGEQIGPWRLARTIGRGGMATVYLAERADGLFDQQVAIKIIRRGLDTEDVIRRFLAERQILAGLRHSNIARLIGGGTTPDGLPYLVMEYVEGKHLTTYCDERAASLEERIRLFIEVCRGVHHAHQNLLVHRDLKPANILITPEGQVKLLDFGIAKILDTADGRSGTLTGFQPLTPEYASPEQVRGEAVTTASDVYQLGLVLCELLSGRRPYEVRALSPARIERAITEASPTRPSGLVDEDAARRRGTGPVELHRRLRGDLDVITLKALRKEPGARYESVAALIRDLERHLEGLPIEARPASILYRARKLLRRRPWVAPAAAAVLLAVGTYIFTLERHASSLERERNLAREEAARSEQMVGFLIEMFEVMNPLHEAGNRGPAELVEFAIARTDSMLADRPDVHLRLLTSLGKSAYWFGHPETSQALLKRTAMLQDEVDGDVDPMTRWVGDLYLASSLYALGEYEAAESAYLEAIELCRSVFGYRSEPVGRTLSSLAWLYHEIGDLDRAERTYREALEIRREASGPDSPMYATSLESLGLLFNDLGQPQAAEPLVRAAIAIRLESYGPWHPNTAYGLRSLGRVLHRRGETRKAEALVRTALDMRRSILGPSHHKFAEDVATLGTILADRGELTEARRMIERALAIRRESLGEEHAVTAVTKHHLATLFHRAGDRAIAEAWYREAVATLSPRFGPDHGWTVAAREDLERLLAGRGPETREWLSGTRLPLPRS